MVRRKEELKPFFSVKHDFTESLDEYIRQGELLSNLVRELLKPHSVIPESAATVLRERLEAYDKAKYGSDG